MYRVHDKYVWWTCTCIIVAAALHVCCNYYVGSIVTSVLRNVQCTCTVRVKKKSRQCYPTLPYLYLCVPFATLPYATFTYPYCYPWVPLGTLLLPTTTAYCFANSAAVAVREYDYSYIINMLLIKAHCLPRAVQCRFVAGTYSAL